MGNLQRLRGKPVRPVPRVARILLGYAPLDRAARTVAPACLPVRGAGNRRRRYTPRRGVRTRRRDGVRGGRRPPLRPGTIRERGAPRNPTTPERTTRRAAPKQGH